MESLVIGLGEVGRAVASVLKCDGIDKGQTAQYKSYKFLHICIPYTEKFNEQIKEYQYLYSPDYLIIHSTVPIGTSKKLGAVHSPIRGVHPELEKGVRTFVKYFGGEGSVICAQLFVDKGVEVKCVANSDDTEALKLWDTTQYGILLLLNKEIHQFCKNNKVDFDIVYTDANRTYNQGYTKLGRSEVVRPFLKFKEEKIGGHCVLQNAKILKSESAYKLRIYDQNS